MSETAAVEAPAEAATPDGGEAVEQQTPATPDTLLEQAGPAPHEEQAQPEADPMEAPIADWSKVKLAQMDGIDPDLVADFGKTVAQATGMSQKQVEAAIKWQLGAIAKRQQDHMASQEAALKQAWGDNRPANSQKVQALIDQVSKAPGLEGFAQALDASGATNNALVLQGLLAIAKLLDEDGTRTGGAGAALPKEQTALEGIQEAFSRARGGNNNIRLA